MHYLTIFISLTIALFRYSFIKLFKDKYQFYIHIHHKPIIILHSLLIIHKYNKNNISGDLLPSEKLQHNKKHFISIRCNFLHSQLS